MNDVDVYISTLTTRIYAPYVASIDPEEGV